MILPDHEIRKYLHEKKIVVEPIDEDVQIQPSGIDLRLGNEFRIFRIISTPFIDTKKRTDDYTEKIYIKDDEPFILHPGEFVLGSIKEYIKLPSDLMAVVDGRSSLGRLGVVIHSTSASINPGWEGNFVLEITNIGKMPVALYPGQRVAKLAFMKLTSPAEKPYNKRSDVKYNKQEAVRETKIFDEKS